MKNISLEHLCDGISLQPEVREQVLTLHQNMDFVPYRDLMEGQFSPATWDDSFDQLDELLDPIDENGFMMLTCMLTWALKTWENYRKADIPDEIFFATMGCFSRFVGEHMTSYGEYGFDRGFWTSRQLAMRLFRVGELEYELRDTEENGKIVHLHIPTNSNFSMDRIVESYHLAKAFLKKYFPDYLDAPMMCSSWLLAPALREVLPETSNIVRFQNLFELISVNEESCGFMQWLYGDAEMPVDENLPEKTSLQRAIKQRLLAGGKVGSALWVLREENFDFFSKTT